MIEVALAIHLKSNPVLTRMCRPVTVVMHGLHIIVGNNPQFFTCNKSINRVSAHARSESMTPDLIKHFSENLGLFVPHQKITLVSLDLNDIRSKINGLIDKLIIVVFLHIRELPA